MDWKFIIALAICIVLFTVTVVTFTTLVPKDSAQNSKLLAIVSVFSFASSIVAYALAQYVFSKDPSNLIQFMLAMVMLIALPASLISVAISTISVSNLRDTLAAGT
jgi:hypothetical protein